MLKTIKKKKAHQNYIIVPLPNVLGPDLKTVRTIKNIIKK